MRRPLIIGLAVTVVLVGWAVTLTEKYRDFVRDDIPYPAISAPPGMKPVAWSYFGFGVPAEWREEHSDGPSTTWTDPAGITLSGGVYTILHCPARDRPEPLPATMTERGIRLDKAVPLTVKGAAGGWRYDLTGGVRGDQTMVQVWLPKCEKRLTLDIYASRGVADRIIGTLVAQERKEAS
ncbi:hypothetical protein [Actinomadura sp. HBU206391]|uniref:hypothetical protein n=1 Tax=Actinomadura sp. HBU206391 TaxID=2731692 RepID=UPI00164F1CC8|nr:hypothetical protein [Actinomadura sp. HBU206391]MBC6459033.1 hypothetical protein [Actinomadura sp. HBU206391]